MNPRCKAVVEQAAKVLGRDISSSEMKSFLQNMDAKVNAELKQLALKDRNAFHAMTNAERLDAVGKRIADQLTHEAIRKRQNAVLQLEKETASKAEMKAIASRTGVKGHVDAILRMIGFNADNRGGVQSLEKRAEAMVLSYSRAMQDALELDKEGSWGWWSNRDNTTAIVKEALGENSGNAEAKKAWLQIKGMLDKVIEDHRRYGGDVSKLEGWLPQKMDMFKVAGPMFDWSQWSITGPKKLSQFERRALWVDDAMKHINREKYVDLDGNLLDDAKMRTFLENAWDTLSTDGGVKAGKSEHASSIANRHKQHRQLHWKNSDSYIAMMDKYGAGNVLDQISSHVQSMSKEMALMERFGPNARHTIDSLLEEARLLDNKAGEFDLKKSRLVENIADSFMGLGSEIANVDVHKFFRTIHDINTSTLLGSILTSQLVDNATALATARALGMSMTEWGIHKTAFYGSSEMKDFARSAGVALSSMIDKNARFGDSMTSNGFWGKAASGVMKASGSNLFTGMHRDAFATFILDQVGGMTRKYDWDTMPQGSREMLEGKGITKQEWDIYRLADTNKTYGGNGIGAKELEAVDVERIKQAIPQKIAEIRKEAADAIARLTAKNQEEAGWVAGRQKKFDDYKAKIEQMIESFEKTREKRAEEMSAKNLAMGGELQMRLEQAEIDMQIANESIKELQSGRADKFFDDVKRGMEHYGRRRSEIGERFGALRHTYELRKDALDASFKRAADELSAKFNKAYGYERTVDGFKEIGAVTKAAKDLDAYIKKMEDRIENAYKKDGTIKSGKEGTVDRAERLKQDAEIEFNALKQKYDESIEQLRQKTAGKEMEIEGLRKAVEAKLERAAVERDITAYLLTEKSEDKIRSMLDTLRFRGDQAVERGMSLGEQLGYRKGKAEARMKAMDKAEKSFQYQAGKEVFAKANELEKRVNVRLKELEDFIAEMNDRNFKRQQVAIDYANNIGKKETAAAEQARRDAILKLTGFAIEEAEMAVLNPSTTSRFQVGTKGTVAGELGMALLQFKQFPWALIQQHYIQRANMQGVSPRLYKLGLFSASTVLGGIALLMGDIAAGKDPREIYSEENGFKFTTKFAFEAMIKGGGLSFFGDILNTDWEGRDPIEKIAGPSVSKVVTLAKLGQDIMQGGKNLVGGDEKTDIARKFIEAGKAFTPWQNLIWTRAAFHNVLLSELNEIAQPGYKARMRNLAEKNHDSGYYLGMDEYKFPNLLNPMGDGR